MNKDKEIYEENKVVGKGNSTNPITSGIIARINSLNNKTSMNKMYGNINPEIVQRMSENSAAITVGVATAFVSFAAMMAPRIKNWFERRKLKKRKAEPSTSMA